MIGWDQFGFSDPATLSAGRLHCYHDLVIVVVAFVLLVVGWFTMVALFSSFFMGGQLKLGKKKDQWLEVFWTIRPAIFLSFIGFVSLVNLYFINLGGEPVFSFRAIGHQWYWEYVYELRGSLFRSHTPKWNRSKFSGLADGYKEDFSNFYKNYKEVEDVNSEDMLLYLEKNYGSFFDRYKAIKKIEVASNLAMKRLFDRLTDGYKRRVSASGDFRKAKAIDRVNSFVKMSRDSLKEIVAIGCQRDEVVFSSVNKLHIDPEKLDRLIVGEDNFLSKNQGNLGVLHKLYRKFTGEVLHSKGCQLRYESYIVQDADLADTKGVMFARFRLGFVTNPCFMCRGVKNEVLVSTVDVMHSWGVPELGIKVDAIPGRVNSGTVVPLTSGIFYGFCYELCGAGHREIPIVVVVLDRDEYLDALNLMEWGQVSLNIN